MKTLFFQYVSLFFICGLFGCASSPVETSKTEAALGKLFEIEAHPEKGFFFGYFLFVPESVDSTWSPVLFVEPNNTGMISDDEMVHRVAAKRKIEKSYINRIAQRLGSPLLVPIFPRPAQDWQLYTHYLNRRTLLIAEGPLQRLDLQLLQMIEDARTRLKDQKILISKDVFLNGFSSSASFSLRWTALHPNMVRATAAGGINALPILPLAKWKNVRLPYPIGIADLKEISGAKFDRERFQQIPQFLYMGALDQNDTVPFRDAWSAEEADLIQKTFGRKMQPDRWNLNQTIYKGTGAHVRFQTYAGVGHLVDAKIEEDLYQFFASHL